MTAWPLPTPTRRATRHSKFRVFAIAATLCMLLFWARYTVPRVSVLWSNAATVETREDLEAAYGLTAGSRTKNKPGRTYSETRAPPTSANSSQILPWWIRTISIDVDSS